MNLFQRLHVSRTLPKEPIRWFLAYFVIITTIAATFPVTAVSNYVVYVALVGFIITFLSYIIGSLIYRRQLHFDMGFIFWWIVNGWIYWCSTLLTTKAGIRTAYVGIGLTAVAVTLINRSLRALYPTASAKAVIGIVLTLMILYIPTNPVLPPGAFVQGTQRVSLSETVTSILDSLKGTFNTCPQLETPLENAPSNPDGIEKAIFVSSSASNGWTVNKFRMTDLAMPTYTVAGIPCIKGNAEGQNVNYWYCGHIQGFGFFGFPTSSDWPYMKKTNIATDGTIGPTERKGFRNVYDTEGDFVRTECYFDPVSQDKKNLESMAQWLMNN